MWSKNLKNILGHSNCGKVIRGLSN
jgi:hypothetical protein